MSVAINTPAIGGLLSWLGKRRLQEEMAQHVKELEELKAGYTKELKKYKDELDRSKRLLEAEIEKTVLVTRVHFETEFEALKAGFGKLFCRFYWKNTNAFQSFKGICHKGDQRVQQSYVGNFHHCSPPLIDNERLWQSI